MESKPDRVWDRLLSASSGESWIRFETDALRHIACAGRPSRRRRHRGHLAQLVERRHDMADVGGSSPSVPTKFQQHDAGGIVRHASQQVRSSVGLERRATNAEVRGSNPFGPTK